MISLETKGKQYINKINKNRKHSIMELLVNSIK